MYLLLTVKMLLKLTYWKTTIFKTQGYEITGTLSGRGEQEVHDTKGIVVQNRKLGETPLELSAKERIDEVEPPVKWSHSYAGHQEPLKPYRKIPLAKKFQFNSYDAVTPETYKRSRQMDVLVHLHSSTPNTYVERLELKVDM